MIKSFVIRKDDLSKVADWLTENISEEYVRWWTNNPSKDWKLYGKTDLRFYIDVTEEEEPMLTFFILKYTQ